MQGETLTPPEESAVAGLTNPRGLGLERFPIRARDVSVTLSAWRLGVVAAEGEGTITLVETASEGVHYRGDGVFLGWPQDRLASAFEALAPKDASAPEDTPQLG